MTEDLETIGGRHGLSKKRKTVSPTQRSLKYWRDSGYITEVVEKWNPHSKTRNDLFGFVDLLAIGNGETVGIQTTSASNHAARVAKITESDNLPALRDANWRIIVQSWRKDAKGKWVCRNEDIS